jgi:SWIB/MDM2 domain
MFKTVPKQLDGEPLNPGQKKGRKNKEIAKEHFDKSMVSIFEIVAAIDDTIKKTDLTPIEIRKLLRVSLRKIKELRDDLVKYKNIQYKTKRVRKSHNTGLEKLRPISESMAEFDEEEKLEHGATRKSRHEVTKILCKYIKDNDLQDPNNRTIILPDNALKNLLQLDSKVVLRYPTMQKYLKHCFEDVDPLDEVESSHTQPTPEDVVSSPGLVAPSDTGKLESPTPEEAAVVEDESPTKVACRPKPPKSKSKK